MRFDPTFMTMFHILSYLSGTLYLHSDTWIHIPGTIARWRKDGEEFPWERVVIHECDHCQHIYGCWKNQKDLRRFQVFKWCLIFHDDLALSLSGA